MNGTYRLQDEVTDYFKKSDFSEDELKTLSRIIKDAQKENTPADDLTKIIEKEVPNASGLKKFFTEGWNLPFLLTVILAVLMYLYPPMSEKRTAEPQKTPETEKPSKRSLRRNRASLKKSPRKPHKKP